MGLPKKPAGFFFGYVAGCLNPAYRHTDVKYDAQLITERSTDDKTMLHECICCMGVSYLIRMEAERKYTMHSKYTIIRKIFLIL